MFKKDNVEFSRQNVQGSSSRLILKDPLGNTLVITNQVFRIQDERNPDASPLQTGKNPIHLLKSEEYLESTSSLVDHPERNIGILTSGGDSSGMNAAVRAITRYALQRQCQPFAIFEGYNGLVEGGDKIKKLGWEDVRGLLSMVCLDFNE